MSLVEIDSKENDRLKKEVEQLRQELEDTNRKYDALMEIQIKAMSFNAEDNSLSMEFKNDILNIMGLTMADFLIGNNALNYIEFTVESPNPRHAHLGKLALSIQRKEGITPAEKAMVLEKENQELKDKIKELTPVNTDKGTLGKVIDWLYKKLTKNEK